MKRIMLKKEIFQGKNQTLPYREFDLVYFEENYFITVDDMRIQVEDIIQRFIFKILEKRS